MAQKRYWNFKADDATADIIRWFNGIIPPGRYFGFDFIPSGDLNLQLGHATTGFTDVDNNELEITSQGKVVTRQGMHIVEDATVTINNVSVGDVTNPRIDVVVLTHEYTALAGGQQALYSIIEGTPAASPVAPALTDPLRQIKIGELYVPANMANLNDVGIIWTQAAAPQYSGGITVTANRAVISDGSGFLTASIVTATELGYLSGVTSNVQSQIDAKQDPITGAASTITSVDLTIDRALVSNGSGKVAVSTVTATELGYLSGVTSSIQTQFSGKQATITGAASTITSTDLTADRALISNGSGKVAVSTVTATELGYLSGVSSAIQTQLNGKEPTITGAATTITSSNLTANRALASDSSGKVAVSTVTATELGYLSGVTSAVQTQLDDRVFNGGNTGSFTKTEIKILDLGDWDMNVSADGTNFLSVAHGLSNKDRIKSVSAFIRNDIDSSNSDFVSKIGTSGSCENLITTDDTNVNLQFLPASGSVNPFDSTAYDTDTAFNRGWVCIVYETT